MPTVDGEKRNQNEIIVSVKSSTVSKERLPMLDCDEYIQKPGIARANLAPSIERPQGSIGHAEQVGDYSVLQQHIIFWDRNGDGVITPIDTYIGFRELGFNIFFSLIAVVVINLNFSLPTRLAHSWIPDPLFRVYVDSIHKSKHGSDSGVIDAEGRFVPQNFENLFSKYDKTGTGSLSLRELFDMMHGHRCAVDPFGWGAAIFEWGTTWLLIQKDGRGSLFWRIKAERKKGQGWKQGFGLGGDWFFGAQKMNPGPLS
ncbi:hypothetical protein IFR04_012181 [Cadophora malorum]|uniref:EF-hand domain-containing protein n=1 Tax=Cadophora malorum TaxID=108018 RepID=A0A8H7T785_9HELO|nr:hypothetical protein IFR04_012181 [Cadophora malorum]